MVPAEIKLHLDKLIGHRTAGTSVHRLGESTSLKGIATTAAPYIKAYNRKIASANQFMASDNQRITPSSPGLVW